MDHAQLDSVVLRSHAWLSNWSSRIAHLHWPFASRRPDPTALTRVQRRSVEATSTEVGHRFWDGLMFALPFGIAFWIGLYFLFSR
jgi:hypothetical protein